MTYLEFKVKLETGIKPRSDEGGAICDDISDKLIAYCDDNKGKYSAFISRLNGNECRLMIGGNCTADVLRAEGRRLWRSLGLDGRIIKTSELSSVKVISALRTNCYVERHDDIHELMKVECVRHINYEERIVPTCDISELESIAESRHITELKAEARRISSSVTKKFIGHPVHYLFSDDPKKPPEKVLDTFVGCLLKANRLETGRVITIGYSPAWRFGFEEAADLYENICGGTVVVPLLGAQNMREHADASEKFIKIICQTAVKFKNKVLTLFLIGKYDKKTESHISAFLNDKITLVSFRESPMDQTEAKEYLCKLADDKNIKNKAPIKKLLTLENNTYYASELDGVFDNYYSDYLRFEKYPAYSDVKCRSEVEKVEEGQAAEILNKMIGLENVKEIIHKSVAFFKLQQIYTARGIKVDNTTKSMIFTGNPGVAKTTVSRLVARIFKDNGIIPNGNLIEVGRADIVAEYVGQTAPLVKECFRKAKGSILFIDEAYSLVDDRDGLYGDEAINTIVQEMENHRDDTIVIFAGYPEKMEKFMNKNPGLRSRIAFHVDFPDYSQEELLDIMKLMVEDKCMKLSCEAEKKVAHIFSDAVKLEDFGNGRFVRNLLEQAIMNLAYRLSGRTGSSLSDQELITLTAEDFIMPELSSVRSTNRIGF